MLRRGFYLLVAGICAVLACASARAQEASSPLRAEQQRIHNAFEAERRAFSEAQQKATTDEERNRLKLPDRDKYTGEMLAATEKNLQDPAAMDLSPWPEQWPFCKSISFPASG